MPQYSHPRRVVASDERKHVQFWSRRRRDVLCALCAVLAIASGFLPEICVAHHPNGSVASVFIGVIVDAPTGEYADTTVYAPWPLCLLFFIGAWYYGREMGSTELFDHG